MSGRVVEMETKPLVATLTFWGSVAGTVLAARPRWRRVAGLVLCTVGYGGLGVAWERTCRCDLRQLGRPPRAATVGALSHLPMAVLGTWLVTRG